MEIVDVYDKAGVKTGKTVPRETHLTPDDYFLVADAIVRNKDGLYLSTKRDPKKLLDGGKWEFTTGWAQAGENSLEAAIRELDEEIGVKASPRTGKRFGQIILENKDFFNFIVDIWLFNIDLEISDITLREGETVDVLFFDKKAILKMQSDGIFLSRFRVPYIAELP